MAAADRGHITAVRGGQTLLILSNRLADWSCRCDKANSVDWQMGPYIHSLDRRFKYFIVTGMDKGLHMW